ncbi:MAG: 4-(cytidine 5'-diphospho)-2-C-methyl-D-erythritol kinase [Candidatus Caenarcaniphilales bacterium]|nr:4-(cytidine 5'-diphospho)-2-C-methyl-D-erythritol kinase [Candidatus Caenarcaniphilales bacterium]
MFKRLSIFAPAKLNLYLKVYERQLDGYHRIETVFQSIDLFDELNFQIQEINGEGLITIRLNPGTQNDLVPTDKRNLIYRAAKAFLREAKINHLNINVNLTKKIPVGGGLAGGSTDAAATLYALNYFLNEPLRQVDLLRLARELGSDIPFCLLGGSMIGTGRGDHLTRLPVQQERIFVLIFPPPSLELKAKDIYEEFDLLSQKSRPPSRAVTLERFVELMMNHEERLDRYLYNSLEEAVIKMSYWVDRAKSAIDARGFASLVSGSGPSVFTSVQDMRAAQKLADEIEEEGFKTSIHRAIDNCFQVIVH